MRKILIIIALLLVGAFVYAQETYTFTPNDTTDCVGRNKEK